MSTNFLGESLMRKFRITYYIRGIGLYIMRYMISISDPIPGKPDPIWIMSHGLRTCLPPVQPDPSSIKIEPRVQEDGSVKLGFKIGDDIMAPIQPGNTSSVDTSSVQEIPVIPEEVPETVEVCSLSLDVRPVIHPISSAIIEEYEAEIPSHMIRLWDEYKNTRGFEQARIWWDRIWVNYTWSGQSLGRRKVYPELLFFPKVDLMAKAFPQYEVDNKDNPTIPVFIVSKGGIRYRHPQKPSKWINPKSFMCFKDPGPFYQYYTNLPDEGDHKIHYAISRREKTRTLCIDMEIERSKQKAMCLVIHLLYVIKSRAVMRFHWNISKFNLHTLTMVVSSHGMVYYLSQCQRNSMHFVLSIELLKHCLPISSNTSLSSLIREYIQTFRTGD